MCYKTTITNVLQNTATSAVDKANLLNNFFASCFNPADALPSYDPVIVPNILPVKLDITTNEVRELLRRTRSHSAPGADLITAWMLSTFAEELAPSITSIFNHSLKFGEIPKTWKQANIVPIPKDANRSEFDFFDQYPYFQSSTRFWNAISILSCLIICSPIIYSQPTSLASPRSKYHHTATYCRPQVASGT